jgi:hypothetical protein
LSFSILFFTSYLTESFFKIPAQRIAPHRLDGTIGLIGMIVFTPSGGLSQIEPVGRLITGPLEPLQVHKGLLEVDRMLIEPLPVRGQSLRHPSQKMGG